MSLWLVCRYTPEDKNLGYVNVDSGYFLDLLLASLSYLHLNQFSFYCDSFFRSSTSLTFSKSKT